jgi:hypothetical protein
LTRTGVNKVAEILRQHRTQAHHPALAEMLRQRLHQAQQPPAEPESVPTAEPEKKEEWRPGEGIGTAPAPTMATALRSRNLPNRKRLSCTINGQEHAVLVRDTGYYRQGESFEVRRNDYGEYEAAVHRSQPRFR